MNEVPEILLYMRRSWFYHESQMAAIARHTKCSYNLLCEFTEWNVSAFTAINRVLARSTSRWVVLMDDDCVPLDDYWLTTLVDCMKRNPEMAALVPKELKGGEQVNAYKQGLLSTAFPDDVKVIEVPWAATYMMLLDREKLPNIHIDDNVPWRGQVYDVCLGFDIRALGYKVGITCLTTVLHPNKPIDDKEWCATHDIEPREAMQRQFVEQYAYMVGRYGQQYMDENYTQHIISVIE